MTVPAGSRLRTDAPDSEDARHSPAPALAMLSATLGRRPRLVTSALIVAVTALAFAPHLWGHATMPWDFVGKESTSPAFVAALFEARTWSEWVPYQGSGIPLSVDGLGGLYFPVWWVLGFLGVGVTLKVVTIVQVAHVAFGALGVAALSRSSGMRWRWAALAGVTFVYYGGFHGGASHAVIVRGLAYLPWLLWSVSIAAPDFRPRRLLAIPLLAWLLASGAYPGMLVAIAIVTAAYVGASTVVAPDRARRLVGPFLLIGVASSAVVGAVMAPYLRASGDDLFFRPFPPIAGQLAAFRPVELFALYLNPFSWDGIPTIMSWSIAIPMLVGVVLVPRTALRTIWPLLTATIVAALVMIAANFEASGEVMTDLELIFPSRFIFSDYKGVVALAMIVMAGLGWQACAEHETPWWRTLISTGLIGLGLLASTAVDEDRAVFELEPTRRYWLVLLIAVAAAGLAFALSRRAHGLLIAVGVVVLVLLDGARMSDDLRISRDLHPANIQLPAEERRLRDGSVQRLDNILVNGPAVRPAREPTIQTREENAHGHYQDSYGYLGLDYEFGNFGGTIGADQWAIWGDPVQYEVALLPWSVVVLPCADCDVAEARRAAEGAAPFQPADFGPSPAITTTRYGLDYIDYAIDAPVDLVVIENELAWPGWGSHDDSLRIIETDLPWRVSLLEAGEHTATTSFREPTRSTQIGLALVALVAWVAGGYVILRGRRR